MANIAAFKIKVPLFIARQVMRHRQFSYQELSRRYTDDKRAPLDFWSPSGKEEIDLFQLAYTLEERVYKLLLSSGVRAEIARSVLGSGLYTQFWMMGDREAWSNYFLLRLDPHTQAEHREVARAMLDLLVKHQMEFATDLVSPSINGHNRPIK